MPESPEDSLSTIEAEAKKKIIDFVGEGEIRVEQVPLAFGLKSLKLIFVMSEDQGSTEPLEDKLASISKVKSVEVTDVRRALG